MSNNKVLYGIAIIAGAGIAIWAGMPPIFLLFLACPIAMMFMMGGMTGMGGMHGGNDDQKLSSGKEQDVPTSPHAEYPHGSPDRN